jgi:hypothetical protein
LIDGVSTAAAPASPTAEKRPWAWLAAPLLVFAFVSLLAGFLTRAADPSGTYFELIFSDTIHMKAWLATAAVTLGLFQLFTAAWIFRKLPWDKPAWVNAAHRWSGRLAFVAVLPVVYHCIFRLGLETGDTRVLVHSLAGSAFFGAYAAKITIVRLRHFPTPVLPVAGGLLFVVLIIVWYTSALWFFREIDAGF